MATTIIKNAQGNRTISLEYRIKSSTHIYIIIVYSDGSREMTEQPIDAKQ
ncbi:hypothetical protein ACFPYJ_07690 [Paenibacillus solisilvae]|uniref:PepSY domain-containing protein n=1 Tax=Paenibacillus solisilvae TaxID=2486751 RepID=A0ABW0VT71_9BACL